MFEYFDLLGLDAPAKPNIASLVIPDGVAAACRQRMAGHLPDIKNGPVIGMLPGAAHGPSKCWPVGNFLKVARDLIERHACSVILLGSKHEVGTCAEITAGASGPIADFSGKTSLQELAAMLSYCDVVITNDSGGMHLSAAVGTPVVAIFGITDPRITGPLGHGHRILSAATASRSRDLAPDSHEARNALRSILPEVVLAAVKEVLDAGARRPA